MNLLKSRLIWTIAFVVILSGCSVGGPGNVGAPKPGAATTTGTGAPSGAGGAAPAKPKPLKPGQMKTFN